VIALLAKWIASHFPRYGEVRGETRYRVAIFGRGGMAGGVAGRLWGGYLLAMPKEGQRRLPRAVGRPED
jgi:hypothetical protein